MCSKKKMAFRRAIGYLKKLSMLPVYRYQQIGLESFEYFIHTWYGMSLINHQFAGKGKKNTIILFLHENKNVYSMFV